MNELSIYDRFSNPGEFIRLMGQAIMKSKMFGIDNASQGEVMALECASRRMPPLRLAERYHFFQGKLSMKTDTMLADFRTKCGGCHVVVSRTPTEATIILMLDGQEQQFGLTWAEALLEPFVYVGKEDPVVRKLQAGKTETLAIKPKYATPRARMQMLWARVVSDGVRAMAPEVVAGHYAPEEINDFGEVKVTAEPETEIVVLADEVTPAVPESAPEPVATPSPVKEAAPPTEKPAPTATKPIVLGGGGDDYAVNDSDPCGSEMANEIIKISKALSMPLEVFQQILAKHGVKRLSDLPFRQASKLLEKLKQKTSDLDTPF